MENQTAAASSSHKQITAMTKLLVLKGLAPAEAKKAAEAVCPEFDFAIKGTLKPIRESFVYFAREGYVKAAEGEPGGEGDAAKCCILLICC